MSLKRITPALLILVLLCQGSCRSKVLSANEFVQYVYKSKSFNKSFQYDSYRVSCQFKPTPLMALTELRSQFDRTGTYNKELFYQHEKLFENALYFSLKISRADSANVIESRATDRASYVFMLNQLSTNSQKSVYLLTEVGDTIRASNYIFQRSYGMSPDADFLYAFPKSSFEGINKFWFVYEDQILGVTSPVKLEFDAGKLLNEIPSLDL